jgi:transcriptional regulator with XRE-family HTH domain
MAAKRGMRMGGFVTGGVIRTLRERKGYTQKQLAEMVMVSDKAVSSGRRGRGFRTSA